MKPGGPGDLWGDGQASVPDLLERERELARIDDALGEAEAGRGSVLLIEAAAGLGKSEIVDRTRGLARRRGMNALIARGHELESVFSVGIVRQLFERVVAGASAAERRAWLAGPAAQASFLATGSRGHDAGDELELIHALYWLAVNVAATGPLLIAVDDLHWADRSSVSFILYLAQRIAAQPIALVAAARPDESGPARDLIERVAVEPATTSIRLSTLTAEATAAAVRRRHPDADAAFCQACVDATGGNPLLIAELLNALAANGVAPDAAGARFAGELAPDSLVRSTILRLDRLPAGARDVAEAAAVLGEPAPLQLVAALAGVSNSEAAVAVDRLAAADIFAHGESIDLSHPLLRAAVYAAIPTARRGIQHREAARLVAAAGGGPEAVSAQLLKAVAEHDPWAVEQLEAAAEEAWRRGVFDSVVRYLERALEEPPAPEARGRLLLRLAEAGAMRGDPDAIERFEEALTIAGDAFERAQILLRLGTNLFRAGRYADATSAFERGVREWPHPDDDVGGRLYAGLEAMRSLSGVEADGASGGQPGPPDVRADPPESAAARALAAQGAAGQVFAVQPHERARALALQALGDGTLARDESARFDFVIAAAALAWSDDFEETRRQIEIALEVSRARGAHLAAADVLVGRAWINHWSARLEEAREDAAYCIDVWHGGWNGQIATARYWLAISLVELDRIDDARAVLADATSDVERADVALAALGAGVGRVALAAGDPELAWRELRAVEQRARLLPFIHNPTVIAWRSDGALAAARLGKREEALRLADEELALARRFGAPRALGVALRARGVVEGGEAALEPLSESVAVLERSPATLDLTRSLVELGAALRRLRRPLEARDPLRRALDLAARHGAVALRERARVELEAAGGRPRRDVARGPDALTTSERRVAELAAAGRSNPQIAAELVVSRKTVENHLASVYRKLEISSRSQLPETLARAGAS